MMPLMSHGETRRSAKVMLNSRHKILASPRLYFDSSCLTLFVWCYHLI
jgi:hypothetical protein